MQITEIDAMGALGGPHDMWLAGIVARADIPLQPAPCRLIVCRVSRDSNPHRKFPIHDLVAVWCLASHGKNIKRTLDALKAK